MSTQEIINIGASPNDGQGDPLRTAFAKINNNFTSLFNTTFSTSTAYSVGNSANQVIYTTPVETFTQAILQIRSSNPLTSDSQDITLSAQITNDNASVRFTGYGTTINGNAITNYDMDVFNSNVRVLVNPIGNATLLHFISSQVTFIGVDVPGLNIQLDGYVDGFDMSTENDLFITTEQA
jgi:hypothetical protein